MTKYHYPDVAVDIINYPDVAVDIIVEKDDKILLIRRKNEPFNTAELSLER